MGYISWTKGWSAADDGTIFTGTHLSNVQSDITTVVNGGITDTNINSGAAIAESKVAFSTSGHKHNGTDANRAFVRHYRKGLTIKAGTTAATMIKVTPGVIDIAGTTLIATADSSDIVITTAGNWADGGSEPADGAVYVYAYNNSGTLAFKLSAEPPDLSDSDDLTAEFPLRYQVYSSVYYRLIGIAHNRTDLNPDGYVQFDESNFATGSFLSDAADETIYLGWTPDYIKTWQPADATPVTTDTVEIFETQRYHEATAAPSGADLNFRHLTGGGHQYISDTQAGAIKTITKQTTSTAGGFVVDGPTNGVQLVWAAWSMGMRGV